MNITQFLSIAFFTVLHFYTYIVRIITLLMFPRGIVNFEIIKCLRTKIATHSYPEAWIIISIHHSIKV